MPRLNLTDAEAKLILRQREIENAHRSGWNKAIDEVHTRVAGIHFGSAEGQLKTDVLASILELKRPQ